MAFLFSSSNRKRMLGDYEVGETIGEGSCSKVKCGRDVNSGKLVALKIMSPDVFRSPHIQQELEILTYFGQPKRRHPNICSLITVLHDVEYKSKHGLPRSSYESRRVSVIVTEYVEGGDLFSYVGSGVPFNEETAQAVFQQVIRGISYLHKHGVVHLDLKPENILLGKNGIVKIADFGLSEIVKPLKRSTRKTSSSKKHRHNAGLRNIASLTSLESLASSVSSLDSSPSQSPLMNFFPSGASSSNGSVFSPGHPGFYPPRRESTSGPVFDLESISDGEEDDALFDAISSGRTRPTSGSVGSSQPTNLRQSTSMTGLSKIGSYNSISSLESAESGNSLYSKESKSSHARLVSPKLVVCSKSGSPFYQAPEVSRGNYDGCKADVYSLGVVLHVMLFGVLPYDDGEWNLQREIFEEIGENDCTDLPIAEWKQPQILSREISLGEDVTTLLRGMLSLTPQPRYSLKAVMRDGWVDASQFRGAVQKVASVVRRRSPYVKVNRENQTYLRKARKRGYGVRINSEALFS